MKGCSVRRPTSKTAFMWHIENVKGSAVICQSVLQSRPEGQVDVFIPGLQGGNSHREVMGPASGLPERTAELGLRTLGSLSLISTLSPPGKTSPSGTTAQLPQQHQWGDEKFPYVSTADASFSDTGWNSITTSFFFLSVVEIKPSKNSESKRLDRRSFPCISVPLHFPWWVLFLIVNIWELPWLTFTFSPLSQDSALLHALDPSISVWFAPEFSVLWCSSAKCLRWIGQEAHAEGNVTWREFYPGPLSLLVVLFFFSKTGEIPPHPKVSILSLPFYKKRKIGNHSY